MEKQLNYDQQLVVNDIENNIILYASAGTGKTFTVANRINNIIGSGRAKPSEILCLTFTTKACQEMTDDIAHYVGLAAKQVVIKTIHSFCLSLVKYESKQQGDSYVDVDVCDDVDEVELLKRLLRETAGTWKLEQVLRNAGLISSFEDVYDHDIAFSYRGMSWIFDKNGERLYVGADGSIVPTGKYNLLPADKIRCPNCKSVGSFANNECATCGYDYRRTTPGFSCGLIEEKPSQLRDVISSIKYARHGWGIYGENEADDYQQTIEKMHSEGTLSDVLTYYSREERCEVIDYALEEFLLRFGGRYMHSYCDYLRRSNMMDFDDLIITADHLLNDPIVHSRWEQCYKFIFIDEMQDTNAVEYHALEKLFGKNNIMMCGDFFQTIYEWRGSEPLKILEAYTKDHNAIVHMFRENYRSTNTLANASFGYLKNIYPRLIGKYCPGELSIHSSEQGERIYARSFNSYRDEARFIYDYLVHNTPEDPTTICVMARSNKYLANLAAFFDEFNKTQPDEQRLRFFTVERNMAFYKTPAVKDILAFYRILLNNTDSLSMERIALNFINRVGLRTIEQIHSFNALGITAASFLLRDTYEHDDCYHTLLEAFESDNIVVYDTETTGLDLTTDQVIQLTAIKYSHDGTPISVYNEIVKPTVPISQGARDTIPFDVDKAILDRGIPAEQAFRSFSDFVRGSVLVGHNSSKYDAPLVSRQLTDLGLEQLDLLGEYDTLTLAKQFYSHLPNYKLSTLCSEFNVVNENAHNALGDVKATAGALFSIIRDKLLPTKERREKQLRKYKKRFEGFYGFYLSLHELLDQNAISALTHSIISTCRLENKYSTGSSARAVMDICELIDSAYIDDGRSFLQSFLQNATFSGSQMDGLIKKLRQIPLITVHQSKGCEFNTVILAGADSNTFPSYAAQIHGREEEESRLFYVAISRAKRKLLITNYQCTGKRPVYQSPFVSSIPQRYLHQISCEN